MTSPCETIVINEVGQYNLSSPELVNTLKKFVGSSQGIPVSSQEILTRWVDMYPLIDAFTVVVPNDHSWAW